MTVVTLYVDASYCPETGAAGWAAWMRKGDAIATRSGRLRKPTRDNGEAEMAAAANGMAAAASSGFVGQGDLLVLVSDSDEVVRDLKNGTRTHASRLDSIVSTARDIAARNGFRVLTRKVKAHSMQDGARSHVNQMVDDLARKQMVEARAAVRMERLETIQASTPPIVAHRILQPSHLTVLPLEFQEESGDDTEPVFLSVSHPFEMDNPDGGALGILLYLRSKGLCDLQHLRRGVEAVAERERSSEPGAWALSCEGIGLAYRGLWERNPALAAEQAAEYSPQDAAIVLTGRRAGTAALRKVLSDGDFPSGQSAADAAIPFIASALMRNGRDGLLLRHPDGSRSYMAIDPAQVAPMPETGLAPRP